MGTYGIFTFLFILLIIIGGFFALRLLFRLIKPKPDEVTNTVKFRTVIFIVLAFTIPLWLITLPLFLYLAYKSYIHGIPTEIANTPLAAPSLKSNSMEQSVAAEIEALHNLVKSGALSQSEFQDRKAILLKRSDFK